MRPINILKMLKPLEKRIESRYRNKGKRVYIDLKLDTPEQLFDERDPAPFKKRDLDEDATDYILSSAKEITSKKEIILSIEFSKYINSIKAEEIKGAIFSHFAYESELVRKKLQYLFRKGYYSLIIGLSFLFICTSFSHLIGFLEKSLFYNVIQEGLLIIGWVAMWHPLNIFLYEWWPLLDLLKIQEKLSTMEVEIVTENFESFNNSVMPIKS